MKDKVLSVIIPCYNEKDTIEQIVEKVRKVKIKKEIIIIDGDSTDGTIEILKEKLSKKVDKIIYKHTVGKGEKLAIGVKEATGDIIIFQDADLEYDPKDYEKVIAPILSGEVDVCYGSRFKKSKNDKGYSQNYIANRFLTFLSNRFNHLNEYLKRKFGERTLKICIDGGFTCPNRDGTCGTKGCLFCGEKGSGEHLITSPISYQVKRYFESYRAERANKLKI